MLLDSNDFSNIKYYLNSEWNIFQPNINKKYCINNFDDGNQKYKIYENEWYIIGNWKEKVSLVNKYEKIFVYSISKWKITDYELTGINELVINFKDQLSSIPEEYKNKYCKEIEHNIHNYLHKYCNHDIINDYIDINPDKSKNIKYCNICYLTF